MRKEDRTAKNLESMIMQALKKEELFADKLLVPLPSELCYGATVDIRSVEQEITDLMVRRACEQMDSVQQFPFNATPSTTPGTALAEEG